MPIAKVKSFAFGGLNTKADPTGLPTMDAVVLQDLRVVGVDLVQRLGMVRLGKLSGVMFSMDFDGSNDLCYAPVDTRVWALGTQFSLETCQAAGTLADSEAVLTVGSTTPCITVDLASSKWRVRIVDSGDTTTTLTSTTNASTSSTDTLQVVRDGASLTLRLNNVSEDTDTMSATNSLKTPAGDLRVGRSGSTEYFDGKVDYVRLFSIAKANHNDRLIRTPNPRAPYVLCDMDFNATNGLVTDRSRYENHLIVDGGTEDSSSLCHNPAPVRALSLMVDEDNKKQLLMAAGGQYYLADVG